MSRKTFFVLAAAALMALAGVASGAAGDDCSESPGEYLGKDGKAYTLTAGLPCELPGGDSNKTTDFIGAQYYDPKCTRPLHFTDVTYVLASENYLNEKNTYGDIIIEFREAINVSENVVNPGKVLYSKEFKNYSAKKGPNSFPVDFCNK